MLKKFGEELFALPYKLYQNTDNWINEKIRPLTQKLDSKSNKNKYLVGYNTNILSIIDFITAFKFIPINVVPHIGISYINGLINHILLAQGFLTNNHTGVKINDDETKEINNHFVFKSNNLSKKLRLASVIEGSGILSFGLYNLFYEKNSSESTYFFISNGIVALNVGLGTYLVQADDEKSTKNKQLFPKTAKNLEGLISTPTNVPI